MSTFKKLLALTLALAMVLSVSAFAGYNPDTYKDATSIDEDCEEAIELLYALDIMKGDNNGNFNPTATITRAEVAKMIYVILNYGKDDKAVNYTGAKMFSDVVAGAWYEGYVNYAGATKLVQGRGNGTFGPNDPVTCAEAAKMLLTAIGYSASDRGYTGANWDKNVLSDAAIIGLLEDYNYNTNTYAPRQWVAVMFQNALLDALTYGKMAPVITGGLLTSVSGGYDVVTMGAKYYGLDEFESVAIATEDAYIDQILDCDEEHKQHTSACYTKNAGDGVLFSNGKEIENTGLKAADLGQEYRVIYSTKTDKAYSVRSLSETAEARVLDMEVTVKHATSSNKPANKYLFTIGDMEAYFEDYEINVLCTGYETDDAVGFITIDVDNLREMIEDPYRAADVFKAIDTDCDGKIDYLFVTEYSYGYVSKVATSNKYGEYINVAEPGTEGNDQPNYLTFNDGANLYLEDCIITDDEIEEENIVKFSWDLDEGMYVMEVLPMLEDAEYEEYDDKNDVFVLDGEEYYIAETCYGWDWEEDVAEILEDEDYLGSELNVIYDGDLVVYVWEKDGNYDNMDDVNAQLVLVLDANAQFSNNTIHEKPAITYMTIDGDVFTKVYQDGSELNFADVDHLIDEESNGKYDNDRDDENYTVEGRLFILHEGTKGRVYLEALDNDDVNEQLSVKTSVLNGYEEKDDELDATGSTITYGDDKVAADNKFFVGAFNSHGEAVYKVMTAAELGKGSDDAAYGQILTYTNAKGTRTTVVGGYFFVDLTSDEGAGYLYIEKIGRVTADGRKVDVVFDDGTEKTISVNEGDSDELLTNVLYSYTYYVMADEYVIELVNGFEFNKEIYDFDDDDYVHFIEDGVKTKAELDDEVIAITTIVIDRDQNQDKLPSEDMPPYKFDIESIEFVALKDLTLDMIENDVDDNTYTQYTDFVYTADDLFYVVVYQVMDTAQNIEQWAN